MPVDGSCTSTHEYAGDDPNDGGADAEILAPFRVCIYCGTRRIDAETIAKLEARLDEGCRIAGYPEDPFCTVHNQNPGTCYWNEDRKSKDARIHVLEADKQRLQEEADGLKQERDAANARWVIAADAADDLKAEANRIFTEKESLAGDLIKTRETASSLHAEIASLRLGLCVGDFDCQEGKHGYGCNAVFRDAHADLRPSPSQSEVVR